MFCFSKTNPIVTDMFTADPGALVYNDTVYIYTGHDEAAEGKDEYVMKNWHIFYSGDMDTWIHQGEALSINSFKWMTWYAWASHVVTQNGKYYWYITGWDGSDFAIGGSYRRSVAVDYAFYENDSTIASITMTTEGVKKVNHAPIKNGVYKIKAKHSNLVLDEKNHLIVQNDSDTSRTQLWALENIDGYSYTLKNMETGRYLSFSNGSLLDTLKTVSEAKQLVIENFNIEDGYRLYADTASEYLADVLNVSTEPNMPLIVWKQTGTKNQSFLFEYKGEKADYEEITALQNKSIEKEYLLFISKTNGIQFSKSIDYAIFDAQGIVIKRGFSSYVDINTFASGNYYLKMNQSIKPFTLK